VFALVGDCLACGVAGGGRLDGDEACVCSSPVARSGLACWL